MLAFIDTEFTDFIDTRLISLACVLENGEEFYVEISDYDRKASSDFVRVAVEPFLDNAQHGLKFCEASAAFYCWLEERAAELPEDEHILLCPDYMGDFELIADLLESFPARCLNKPILLFPLLYQFFEGRLTELDIPSESVDFDVMTVFNEAEELFFSENPQEIRHHALSDARANRFAFFKACDALSFLPGRLIA